MTFKDGVSASGGEGRKTRSGIFRSGVVGLEIRMLFMRWWVRKSSVFQ